MTKPARLRTFWWTVHRWIGLGLTVLLVPIAVSGALLVWHDPLDALLHPSRYAVTGTQLLQPSAYLASATAALDGSAQPVGVRFPEDEGWPVIVMARGAPRVEGGPIRFVNVYLDPPTARTLDVVDFRSSLIGWLHRFHENLTIPEYSGRAIVGWAGVGMLILSLTGIWLWWPRNGAFLPGLRWRRSAQTTTNLHHLLGFWISIPLAVVSFTGVYLGFPQTMRQMMSSIAPMNPQGPRPGAGTIARDTRLTPDSALSAAVASQPDARPAVIFLPVARANTGDRGRAPGAEREGAQRRRRECRRPGLARAVAECGERRDRHRHGGRSQRQRGTSAGAARRRPRSAMDPVDPRGQPQRPGLAIRRVPDGGLPIGICRDGRDHVVAGQAGPQGRCRAHSRPRRTASSRVKGAAPRAEKSRPAEFRAAADHRRHATTSY